MVPLNLWIHSELEIWIKKDRNW